MDLSLATDTYSNAYLYQQHHHHLQQQEQQQQHQHLTHHQQQQQQQQHYQYHHSQHPQALSLAPPSGKGFFDLESLGHTSASSSLGLGHLGAAASYQPEYGLSSYTVGATNPSSSSASALSSHHLIPSYSPGQLWARNSASIHSPQLGAAQNLHYSSARAAPTSAQDLHFAGYSGGAHSLGDDRTGQMPLTQGWAVSEPHRSQWSQQLWDNCLPPGVEPSATAASNAIFSQMHQGHTPSHPHLHPPTLDLQIYRQPQKYTPLAVNMRTGKPPQKLVPKRKPAKDAERKIPVVKATVMKNSGAARGLTPEKGLGWCSVCQRNCVTEVALRQHLEGKGHRRKVERQKVGAEVAVKTAKEDGGVTNMLEQVWMQVSMMGKPAQTAKPKKKRKAEEAGKDVQHTKANAKPKPIIEGEHKPIIKEEPKPTAEGEPSTMKKKVVEIVCCELCNVECNSQTVLEIHLGGRKHAARLKKSQESVVACSTEQPS